MVGALMVTAGASPAAAVTATPAQIVVPNSTLYSVDCVTPSTCYATGRTMFDPQDGPGSAAIFPVIDGIAQAPVLYPPGYSFGEVVCYEGTTCVVYGGFTQPGVECPGRVPCNPAVPMQVVIVNGVFGEPQPTPGGRSYSDVACFNSTYCVGLTNVTVEGVIRPALVVISNGVPGAPQAAPEGIESLNDLDCASATACYAVGQTPPDPDYPDPFTGEPAPVGVVVPITNGVVGAPQVVGSVSALYDVGCASATTCYAIGPSTDFFTFFFQPVVVPIVNGVPGTPKAVPGFNDVLVAIDCLTAAICEAVGFNNDGATVVPIINGTPGPAQPVAGANGLHDVACLAPNCLAIGSFNPPNAATIGVVTLITEPDLVCNGQTATSIGTPGVDRLLGTPGKDSFLAYGGNDSIYGYGGNDNVCAGAGNDVVRAGAGNDWVDGGAGNDTLVGEAGNDNLMGGDGSDRIFAVSGNDQLNGGPATDYCYKGTGTNSFTACEVFPAGM